MSRVQSINDLKIGLHLDGDWDWEVFRLLRVLIEPSPILLP